MLDLEQVKQYLRIDAGDEDILITSLITTSTEIVEGVIRQKLSDFDIVPETLNQAVLFCVATLYEQRQGGKDGLDMQSLLDVVRRLTFMHRKEGW